MAHEAENEVGAGLRKLGGAGSLGHGDEEVNEKGGPPSHPGTERTSGTVPVRLGKRNSPAQVVEVRESAEAGTRGGARANRTGSPAGRREPVPDGA